jgi:hypothetical protein
MINLHDISMDVAEMIRPVLKSTVAIGVDMPGDLTMEGDPEKIAEILVSRVSQRLVGFECISTSIKLA